MRRRPGPVPVLAALVAALLTAAGFAATSVVPEPRQILSGRVGPAGFAQESLVDDVPAPAAPLAATSTVAPRPTATVPPSPSTTRARSIATTVPTTPAPAPPGAAPTTTVKAEPPASSWSKTENGITVRMHMEPATPVAGQPVTFVLDEVTAPVHCCVIHMAFGTGTTVPVAGANGDNPEMGVCGSPPVTRTGLRHTHTFTEPGAHKILVMVLSTGCQAATAEDRAGAAVTAALPLQPCIVVGPWSGVAPRCPEPSPMPPPPPPR